MGVAEPDIHERTVVERRDPLLGQVFDRRFRIDAKIAAGGFGAIYRVTRLRDGEELALKVLHPNLTNDPGVVARFRREGVALTRLRDPNTITAYELGEAEDRTLYILMELLRGESLYERFRVQGALPWRPVLALARAVCSSLSEAHALGIIHRDLKPTNIHLEPGADDVEFVKVLDFGIAKILKGSDFDASELTHAGQMIGTLDYMSPEQMVGGQCGPSSDLYTLGIVMYEMIAGKKPFDDAVNAAASLAAVLTTTPARLASRAMVPVDVDRIVMRCLERQAEARFQSADALAAAIDEVLDSDEQVTSLTPRVAPDGRTGIAMPRTLTPIQSLQSPAASRPNPAPGLPGVNLDSTLVGHEPVARLPAGPLKGTAGRGSQPRMASGSEAPPRRPSQPVIPNGFAPALMPAKPPGSLPILTTKALVDDLIDDSFDSASSLDSSQDSATQLRMRLETTQDDAAIPEPTDDAAYDARNDATGDAAIDATVDSSAEAPAPPPARKLIAARTTPHAGVPVPRPAAPQVPVNLREAYPTIHHQPPSPTRPASAVNPFDDRPSTGVRSADAAYPSAPRSRLPWIALGIALVLALAAAWLLIES